MSILMLGSKGEKVRRIQKRLQMLGTYTGSLDGIFGSATDSAVRVFQNGERLSCDGIVGPQTWMLLFKEKISSPGIFNKPLDYRCLALTGSFETGAAIPDCFAGLSGDFDDQGISLGVLQWNFGQETLQPLLKKMFEDHEETARALFNHNFKQLAAVLAAGKPEQMGFARSIQDLPRKTVKEPWRGMFKALGRTDEFQRIQLECANALYKAARKLCIDYGLWSERAVALMFDIKTQNGSISKAVQMQIMQDFREIPANLSAEEQEQARLRIVGNRRAEAANARWIEDVRDRKLCIANGSGTVHGVPYDLEGQFGFGLGLRRWGIR